jgi:MFS family permease
VREVGDTTTTSGPVAVLPYAEPTTPPLGKTWSVGTLAYTRTGLVKLFFWLLGGDFFWQLRERAISPTMPLLLRKFGGTDFLAGLLIHTMPAVLSILLAPVVSYRSDRFRSRIGRRIPFLLVSTPPAFLSMVGLAMSPWIGRTVDGALGNLSPGVTACVLGSFAVFWFIFDLALIVTNSVHHALINDVVPKAVIGRFFGLFRVLSLGAGMLFNWYLLGLMEEHYVGIFVLIGVFFFICFSVMCIMVKEGEYPPPPPPKQGTAPQRFAQAVQTYFQECFTHPYYLWFFMSYLLAHMAFAPINLFSLYFAQSVGMSMFTYGKYSAIQLFCSLVQAPILGWIADKIHPLRLTIVALALYATASGLAFAFVRDARTFALAHVLVGTVSGFWLTATAALPQMLLPRMKFATYFSALAIFQAIAMVISAPIVGAWLDWINKGKPPAARDYHSIYLWSCAFILLSLFVTLIVHRYFMLYGGRKHYVAPE